MRQSKLWFRTSKNAWYVQLGDQQTRLGPRLPDDPPPKKDKTGWVVPERITTAWHQIMAGQTKTMPKSDVVTVATTCDLFLQYAERHNDAVMFRWYKRYLQDFCEQYGTLAVIDLKPFHVTRWLDAHQGWTAARRHAITAIKRAFNWATDEGVIAASPIKSVKKPSVNKRPAALTRDQRKEILDAIDDEEFRLFVEAMQESGCRPSEVSRVTAANVDLELGVWMFEKHKTGKVTKKPRVVLMSPRLVEITTQLMTKHPEGALFRGPRLKKPFGMHGICSRFRRLWKKLPHLKHAVADAIRHGYATDALMNGVGVAQVAVLLGHTDTTMVSAHYSHIAEQAYMRDVAKKASGA